MVDKLKEVYESDPLAMASAYGVEAVDPEETVEAVKDVARFGWESLPGVGTYYTVQDITQELEQESPNYLKIGMLAGTEVIGLIPGLGDAAASMIRKGADLAKPAQEVVEVTSNVPKVTRKDADVLQAENLLDDPDALKAWQEENKLPETQRQANPEESQLAADALFEGEATSQETRRRIREAIPAPQEFTAEQVMEMMPTVTEVTGSLGKKAGQYGILGVKGFDLKEGQKVSSRLDIPAYNNFNTWVVSIAIPPSLNILSLPSLVLIAICFICETVGFFTFLASTSGPTCITSSASNTGIPVFLSQNALPRYGYRRTNGRGI